MGTQKVIYLLNILRSQTRGHDAELNRLYADAIQKDKDACALNALVQEYDFYGGVGGSMHSNAEQLLEKLRADPSEALQTLQEIRQAHEMIQAEAALCGDLMRSAKPFSQNIPVLRRRDKPAYLAAYKLIAWTCVYLMALYDGMKRLRHLTWSEADGIQELIHAVNTKYLPELCRLERPAYSWVIRKKRLGGSALFGGEAFFLSYENTQNVEVLCGALHKEPIGSHAFLNIRAFEADETDVPYCWGVGNLLSVSPANAWKLLQGNVATTPRSPTNAELAHPLPAPAACLQKLTDNRVFCVSPDDLLLAMNQWQMGREIAVRKQRQVCLFCGRPLQKGRLVCPSHFTSEM